MLDYQVSICLACISRICTYTSLYEGLLRLQAVGMPSDPWADSRTGRAGAWCRMQSSMAAVSASPLRQAPSGDGRRSSTRDEQYDPRRRGLQLWLQCLWHVANISRAYIFAGPRDGAAPSLARAVVTCASGLMQPTTALLLSFPVGGTALVLHFRTHCWLSSRVFGALSIHCCCYLLYGVIALLSRERTPQHIARIKDTHLQHPSITVLRTPTTPRLPSH
jgi:hypothetical protein